MSEREATATKPTHYSRAAKITTAVVAVIVAVHMFFTMVYNVPSQHIKNEILPGAAAAAYMEPLFVQDYKIFAPDPAGADHQLWIRAWFEDIDGEPWTSEWVNVSAVELSELYRKILRKQLTIVGAERFMSAYTALTEAQREIVATNYHRIGLEQLRDDLIAADPGGSAARVNTFIRSTQFVDAYATQAAYALWGDLGEVTAVQTRVVYDPVIRWSDRNDPDAQRPAATITDTGWRPLLEFEGQSREKFAETFLSWADD